MSESGILARVERLIFGRKKLVLGLFALLTAFFLYVAVTQLRVDAAFSKQLPLEHPYMQTFQDHYDQFGGADRIIVALVAEDGDMFDPEFFTALQKATDAVFFVPGVDRPKVQSLFTPNVRYLEVVEDGIQGGNVIPDDFVAPEATVEDLDQALAALTLDRDPPPPV